MRGRGLVEILFKDFQVSNDTHVVPELEGMLWLQ